MPRIRTVKPEHWNDKELTSISLQAHLLWIGMWNFSDDEGVIENDPFLIRSQIFPRRQEIRTEQIKEWLDQLVKARFIIPFTHNGVGYYISRTFGTHQRIDKPLLSKIPKKVIQTIFQECSKNDTGTVLLYSSVLVKEGNGKGMDNLAQAPQEINSSLLITELKTKPSVVKKTTPRPKFVAPCSQEVKEYLLSTVGNTKSPVHWPEDKCHNFAGQFIDHYTANGWKQGRGKPIVDWMAACRIWIRNEKNEVFTTTTVKQKVQPALKINIPVVKSLDKVSAEINYLFESFKEHGSLHISVVSTDNYNHLKKHGLISFSEETVKEIRQSAIDHIANFKLDESEITVKNFMKRFGVIQFLKQYNAQGKTVVFELEQPAAETSE